MIWPLGQSTEIAYQKQHHHLHLDSPTLIPSFRGRNSSLLENFFFTTNTRFQLHQCKTSDVLSMSNIYIYRLGIVVKLHKLGVSLGYSHINYLEECVYLARSFLRNNSYRSIWSTAFKHEELQPSEKRNMHTGDHFIGGYLKVTRLEFNWS